MSRKPGMGAWLATLSGEQLVVLLRARPDAVRPEPRSLGELAGRLSVPHSVGQALAQLSRPAMQVAEALLAVGGSATRAELHGVLGVAGEATAHQVDRAVDELTTLALAWPSGEWTHLSGGWRELMADPLALGRSGRELFGLLTVAQLSRIGSAHGIEARSSKTAWVDVVAAAAQDPATVAARLERAGRKLAEIVERVAWRGPRVAGVRFPNASERVDPGDVGVQLVVQGWVVPVEWGGIGEMPREVALAVRGPDYHAPFDAEPPQPATAAVDADRLREASRYAAGAAVEMVRRLLALLDRAPLATLQAGGVGVRELRRAAKALSADEASTRLWLEVAGAAGIAAPMAESVLMSTAADRWLAADPAAALARLLLAWWQLPIVPSHRFDDAGKPAPALLGSFRGPEDVRLRADVLATLAALGPGRGLVDTDAPVALLLHHRPAAYGGEVRPRVCATLAEAQLLGLVAGGALTPLGAELLDAVRTGEPEPALAAAAAGLLPAPTRTARFLPDLTVIVAGGAAAELSRLLDDVADAESRDTASTWRFTPASVRRALDAGRTADELLTALAGVADNPLPQPLAYLVRDVARRHGQLQVLAVASCVRVADAALAAEVAAHRALAPLQLRTLADTVLASARPVGETIAALRKAGYAPVRQDACGATVVERPAVRRAEPKASHSGSVRRTVPADVVTLAARLAKETAAPRHPAVDGTLLAEEVPQLSSAEVAVLGYAIAHRSPVLIGYVSPSGRTSTRIVEPRMKLLGTLVARCLERQGDQNFALDRIAAVSAVEG